MTEGTSEKLGKYEILEEIGRGGFATVYRAVDTTLDREVALKVLHPQLLTDPAFVARFQQEARALAKLRHPHIVTVYEVAEVDGRLFIAMALARGPSLDRAIADQGRIPWGETLAFLEPVCQALDYAHGQGVVHRDLKPANVLLDQERGALLTDFGFARLVGESSVSLSLSGGIVGTPAYIAPEVWELDVAEGPADVYALGCIVYEMLTGEVLFGGSTPMQVMRAHDRGPKIPDAWPQGVPTGIGRVLEKACARTPGARYRSAGALRHALLGLEAEAKAAREAARRAALAAQWRAEAEAAVAAGEWSAARMAGGRWLALAPDDIEAKALLAKVEVTMAPRPGEPAPEPGPLVKERESEPEPLSTPHQPARESSHPWATAYGSRVSVAPQPQPSVQAGGGRISGWAWAVGAVIVVILAVFGINSMVSGRPTPEPQVIIKTVQIEVTSPAEVTPVPEVTPAVEVLPDPDPTLPPLSFSVRPGSYLAKAVAGEYAGTQVIVDGPFTDADEVKFKESYKAFEEATGIDVNYIGTREFEGTISLRVEAGDAPDIADFPQPGMLASFVRQGKIVDVSTFIPQDWLSQQYNQSWLDVATMQGPSGPVMAGVWHRFNTKSLVWYPKDDFEATGYEVPGTWDELMALTQQIADDGDTAWCIGIESSVATGWPATDWLEDILLRTTSLDNYDKWTSGNLKFSSPEVRHAAGTLAEIWFNQDYVYGGRSAIVSTFFGDSPLPMFEDPPRCWLHKQGNFITGFFPEGSQAGVDYGVFYLPSIDPAYGRPFLIAGDIMAMFNDRPEVRALMEYFTLPQSASGWLQSGSALAAHQTASPSMYDDGIYRDIAGLVAQATSFRWDGSDLMPGEVGTGTFWVGMVDWVSGAADLDTVLKRIDDSWPR